MGDRQNTGEDGYVPMAPDFEKSLAFQAATQLIQDGVTAKNGLTEPVLHAFRRKAKARKVDMKVTAHKNAGFYTKAAANFLRGTDDADPVEELTVSAMGEAISVGAEVVTRIVDREKLASIVSASTEYPEISGHRCAVLKVKLLPVQK